MDPNRDHGHHDGTTSASRTGVRYMHLHVKKAVLFRAPVDPK